jgi:hypothetical protein
MSDNHTCISRQLVVDSLIRMIDQLSVEELESLEDFIVNECEEDENIFRTFILG